MGCNLKTKDIFDIHFINVPIVYLYFLIFLLLLLLILHVLVLHVLVLLLLCLVTTECCRGKKESCQQNQAKSCLEGLHW